LKELELPEILHDAVSAAAKIRKFEARRRQMQYVGRLMRDVDPAPIRAKLEKWLGNSRRYRAHLHLVERWRERLLAGETALAQLLEDFPQADAQRLQMLVSATRHEAASGRPPRSFRALFHALQQLIPEPRLEDS
ncbi:MAG: ribosome biogenesis factor YjgA, partial [Burkholderiales bacterium]